MKQLKLFLSVACAVAIVAPAFANKLTVSGGGSARFGYTSQKDLTGAKTTGTGLVRKDDFFKISFNVASDDDKFTASAQFRTFAASGTNSAQAADGWAQYDFGTVAVKYTANGLQNGWDNDILGIHDETGPSNESLNIAAKVDPATVFVTLLQTSSEGYVNKKERTLPIIQFGVTVPVSVATITAGIAFDSKKTPISNATVGDKKTGYVAFLNLGVKATDTINIKIDSVYASNYGGFAQEVKGDNVLGIDNTKYMVSAGGKAATLFGTIIGVDVKVTDADTISLTGKYSQLKQAVTIKDMYIEAAIAHALNANFTIKAGFDYGSEKNGTTATGTEVYTQATYSF
jgi:hypothetical protein